MYDWDFLLNSLIKFLLTIGFIIILSIERERHSHPGGVVTHLLVGLGSCLYSIISIRFDGEGNDPTRIAAQIVSGMGFLGSATVFKSEKYVKGINTAANLWIAAAVGMGIGLGFWDITLLVCILVFLILIISNALYNHEKKKKKRRRREALERKQSEDEEIIIAVPSPSKRIYDDNEIDDDDNCDIKQ